MKTTILVADDNPQSTELTRCYLARCGYRVLTASGGVECLSIIRNESLTAIVASVNMRWGGVDGLVNYLQEEFGQHHGPSVILIGNLADVDVAELRKEPNVSCYLRKPFLITRLLKYVQAIESQRSETMPSHQFL